MVISVRDAVSVQTETSKISDLKLYQQPRTFDSRDIRAVVLDFFSWLEQEWRQPVLRDAVSPLSALLEQVASNKIQLDEQREYTRWELAALSGYNRDKVIFDLTKHRIPMRGRVHRLGISSLGRGIYLGHDLAPVIEEWEWKKLCAVIDIIWTRFVKEPCGECEECLEKRNTASFVCKNNNSHSINVYRRSFYRLLQALRKYGDIESWWNHEREAVFECRQGSITAPTKLILLYLLDRQLLELSLDDMLRISFRGIDYIDLLRPFRHRRPDEYSTLLRGLELAQYGEVMRIHILAVLAVLIILKHGFPGLTELGRQLSPEELQQVVREGRLITPHLGYGIYLDFPLSDDVCVGHVVLDEIRMYFWKYAADVVQQTGQPNWDKGPRCWTVSFVNALERILTANIWNNGQALLTPRVDTALARINPYSLRQRAEQEEGQLGSLPPELIEAIQVFNSYRYEQYHIELTTIASDLRCILSFFSWVKGYTDVSSYVSWDRDTMRDIAQAFLAEKRPDHKSSYLHQLLVKIHIFFETLAEIGLPYPPGYPILRTFFPSFDRGASAIPTEEVLDRLFRDGVCQLDYDPYARLALTIQYFCGTRVRETCDLPVFCIVEDPDGRFAYLVIPRGKTKKERSFPIVSTGMGSLLEYMDQIVHLQLDDQDQIRNFSRTNIRYLDIDIERAYYWDYLFDRQNYSAGHAGKRLCVLTPIRVNKALKEAILLAAKKNPDGFFLQETYSPSCHHHIQEGKACGYLSHQDGVTVCPMCGGSLPGQRGHHCGRKVTRDIKCDGVATDGSYFCPKCDAPLAKLVSISSHTFRHNSVTRAHRHGVPLAENMLLHGHLTVPMHLRYLHLLPEDQQDAVHRIFSEKLLRDLQRETSFSPGQIIEDGVAHTINLAQYFGHTLRGELKRGTFGLWGGFWIGALAEEGTTSPIRQKANIVVTEDTYDHMVAQYRYEALCLAISEVALERGTKGKFKAMIAPFLEPREIDQVVSAYLEYVQQGYLSTTRGVRLIEADIKAQRLFLDELAEMLRPWWQHLGSIDRLVSALFPEKDVFGKYGETYAIEQEHPPAESAS